MIDKEGYRANVGIILCNSENKLLWARRIGQNAWQFPQGGIKPSETPEEALMRELWEEVGLHEEDVQVLGATRDWLRYRLPKRLIRHDSKPVCIGQKQRWFLLRLAVEDSRIRLSRSEQPEFDSWCWVDYWHPLEQVVTFKREVYEKALQELEPLLARPALARTAGEYMEVP